MTSRIGAKALGDQLYSYIGAIRTWLPQFANLAFEGFEPGPRLTADQVDAIHLSIITIAGLAGEDLIQLLTELEVPA